MKAVIAICREAWYANCPEAEKTGYGGMFLRGARRKKSLNVKVSSTIENEIVFPAYIS
jgi:hypothetical protein